MRIIKSCYVPAFVLKYPSGKKDGNKLGRRKREMKEVVFYLTSDSIFCHPSVAETICKYVGDEQMSHVILGKVNMEPKNGMRAIVDPNMDETLLFGNNSKASQQTGSDDFVSWDGNYEKQHNDVMLRGGIVVKHCWPNDGCMYATDGSERKWSIGDDVFVRPSVAHPLDDE